MLLNPLSRFFVGTSIYCCLIFHIASAQNSDSVYLAAQRQKQIAFVGKPFPAFSFPGSLGRTYSNKDFLGKATVVEVWELGCMPCMFSVKYFNTIHDSLGRAGFQLFSMIKNDWDACLRFAKQDDFSRDYMAPKYEVMSMGSAAKNAENVGAINQLNSLRWPFFLIVDSKGIVRDVRLGFSVGNDVHAERPTKVPYSNSTVQWIMDALRKAEMAR